MNSTNIPLRSAFVTGVAWTFIVIFALALTIVLVQFLLATLITSAGTSRVVLPPMPPDKVPILVSYMFENPKGFAMLIGALAALGLVVSTGLLKRMNLARIMFIGILVLIILWGLIGVAMQVQVMFALSSVESVYPRTKGGPEAILPLIAMLSTVFSIGVTLVFMWIVKRLWSPAIRAEFVRA